MSYLLASVSAPCDDGHTADLEDLENIVSNRSIYFRGLMATHTSSSVLLVVIITRLKFVISDLICVGSQPYPRKSTLAISADWPRSLFTKSF